MGNCTSLTLNKNKYFIGFSIIFLSLTLTNAFKNEDSSPASAKHTRCKTIGFVKIVFCFKLETTGQKCESLNCWCQTNRQMIIKLIVSYVCKMTSHSMFYNFILAHSHKRHEPIESFECVNIYHDFNCMVNEQIHTTLFLRPVTA